jgi:hypothetical protein
MLTAVFVIALSEAVTDGNGHTFPKDALPSDAATTIANVCEAQTFIADKPTCAAILVVMAARESGFNIKAVGDGGKAVGAFQLHYKELGLTPSTTWTKQITDYLPWLAKSMKICPEYPLAPLAGSCRHPGSRVISTARILEAKRILEKAGTS